MTAFLALKIIGKIEELRIIVFPPPFRQVIPELLRKTIGFAPEDLAYDLGFSINLLIIHDLGPHPHILL